MRLLVSSISNGRERTMCGAAVCQILTINEVLMLGFGDDKGGWTWRTDGIIATIVMKHGKRSDESKLNKRFECKVASSFVFPGWSRYV
jgi:hypothetical protein